MTWPRLVGAAAVLLIATACGSDSPTAPSVPSTAQIAGVWRGTLRTDSVAGGECVGSLLQSTVGGIDTISAAVTQSGANVTAAVTTIATGGVVNYTGTAGATGIQLSWTTCTSCNVLAIRCSATATRDLRLVTSTITGTVSGNTITGTEVDTYNVISSTTGVGVGTLTATQSLSVTRQ